MNLSIAKTIVAVGPQAPKARVAGLTRKGAEILTCKAKAGLIDIKDLLKKLGELQVTSVLVEGGGEVNASFIEAGAVDKAHFNIVPKIFGGQEAKTPVEGEGIKYPSRPSG